MSTRIAITRSTKLGLADLKAAFSGAEAVVIGAGAGLSTAAGFTYTGERFERYFADFIEKYHFTDMYTAGFYNFESPEEYWAYWSRYIYYNRYVPIPNKTYENLLSLVKDKNYFVITTNVDHCFQKAGFDPRRLFATQGDYGLLQCSIPCHMETYDNESLITAMVRKQIAMRVPSELIPFCPRCGKPLTMNLRADDRFVEDENWHEAMNRYERFIHENINRRVVYLELGVGFNTPGIIKYPFWELTLNHPLAAYVCVNQGQACCPVSIASSSILFNEDIATFLTEVS